MVAINLLRAAALSFGFVYLHPMSDGNGRISRFLINDTLRRDRAVPAPFILPVSATITSTLARRQSYDEVLELLQPTLLSLMKMVFGLAQPEQFLKNLHLYLKQVMREKKMEPTTSTKMY